MIHKGSKPNKTFEKDTKQTDSTTNVYPTDRVFHGGRKVVSFRCNEELWNSFKMRLKADSVTTCHILESMISAVLGVYPQLVNKRNTVTVENLHVRRVVGKPRRVFREFVAESNFYDGQLTCWRFVEDAVLNVHGHASGCACSVCRVKKESKA